MTDAESRACGQVTLILYDAPNHKSSDAGNVEMPERSLHGLPSSENVNILDLIMKEKKSNVEIYSQNEFSVHEIVKKEKYALVLLSPHTAKVTSTVRDKCLVKMEKALNMYSKILRQPTFT